MGALILPSRFNQQPQQSVPLDPSYFGTAAKNVNHPNSPMGVGVFSGVACEVRASRAGMAWVGNGSGSQRITSNVSGYPLTVIGSVVARDVTTNRVFTTVGAVAGASNRIQIDVNAGTLRAIAVGSTTQTQTVTVAINQVLNYVFVCDSATSRRLYLNGRLVSTNTTSCTFSDTFTTIAINCGANATFPNGSQFIDGDTALNVVAQVALSDAKARELSLNPWGMFEATPRRLWNALGGATDTPLNPGAGAILLTGYAPTIARTANQAVSPAVGAVVIAGYAPTITRTSGQSVTPAAGAMVVAGYAPTVTRTNNQAVAPGAGNLIITGFAPTITRSVTGSVNPAPGAITVAGYAPTITRTSSTSVQPGRGQIAVIGYAPSLYQGPPVSYPQFNMFTIMRRSRLDAQASTLTATQNAQGGTMAATLNIPTIMSRSPVNAVATLSSAAINRTAVLL